MSLLVVRCVVPGVVAVDVMLMCLLVLLVLLVVDGVVAVDGIV